jgi:hypothetical protein
MGLAFSKKRPERPTSYAQVYSAYFSSLGQLKNPEA